LENRLDAEDIDDSDRVFISEQISRLTNPDLTTEDEKRIWQRIKDKAGAALAAPAVRQMIEGIATKLIREQIGI
jgi:hypothetical protein